jgi:hypothetical protein
MHHFFFFLFFLVGMIFPFIPTIQKYSSFLFSFFSFFYLSFLLSFFSFIFLFFYLSFLSCFIFFCGKKKPNCLQLRFVWWGIFPTTGILVCLLARLYLHSRIGNSLENHLQQGNFLSHSTKTENKNTKNTFPEEHKPKSSVSPGWPRLFPCSLFVWGSAKKLSPNAWRRLGPTRSGDRNKAFKGISGMLGEALRPLYSRREPW